MTCSKQGKPWGTFRTSVGIVPEIDRNTANLFRAHKDRIKQNINWWLWVMQPGSHYLEIGKRSKGVSIGPNFSHETVFMWQMILNKEKHLLIDILQLINAGGIIRIHICSSCNLKLMDLGQWSSATANMPKQGRVTFCLLMNCIASLSGKQSHQNRIKLLDLTARL